MTGDTKEIKFALLEWGQSPTSYETNISLSEVDLYDLTQAPFYEVGVYDCGEYVVVAFAPDRLSKALARKWCYILLRDQLADISHD